MFSFVGVIAAFIITTIITRIYHKVKGNDNPGYLGAMNQGSWRSNYLIVGYPVLYNLYGDAMILNYALVILVVIPMYNILATLALSNNKGIKSFDDLKDIVTKLLQNPLIIAVIVGFVFNLLGIKIPMVATNFLNMIGGLATPLGLIAIGAFFHFDELKKSLSKSVIVTSLKLLVYPLIATTVAYFLGFSQMDIVMIAVLFGGPTSVSSFAMAKEMKSDPVLAGNIVILTSALCAFTYMIVISMWLSIA
jgi:predicted permease